MLPEQARTWVEDAVGDGARVVAVWPLSGGSSSPMHGVDVVDARGSVHELVLRRILDRAWLEREPDLAAREAAALEVAAPTRLVPALVALDARGNACGAPAVLSERIAASVDLAPDDQDSWLRQLAGALSQTHALPAEDPRFPHAGRGSTRTRSRPRHGHAGRRRGSG